MRIVFVHGSCVSDAEWWWHRMVRPLADLGLESRSVSLPSCTGAGPGLHADADAVRAVLDEDPGNQAILCGHSYGGMVVTDAAAGRQDVSHLLYIAGAVPDHGESIASLAGPEPAPWVVPREDGTVVPNTDVDLRAAFLQDCDDETAEGALQRLVAQSQAAFVQAPREIAWYEIPSTYLVCAEDRATPPAKQREFARHTSTVIELPTGHHPFLSRPELLAQVLGSLTA